MQLMNQKSTILLNIYPWVHVLFHITCDKIGWTYRTLLLLIKGTFLWGFCLFVWFWVTGYITCFFHWIYFLQEGITEKNIVFQTELFGIHVLNNEWSKYITLGTHRICCQ